LRKRFGAKLASKDKAAFRNFKGSGWRRSWPEPAPNKRQKMVSPQKAGAGECLDGLIHAPQPIRERAHHGYGRPCSMKNL
jgi:hypothetical protein